MALTLEQEAALLALLDEKRITLPELTATAEIKADDLLLTNQLLADKSVTAKVLKDYIAPPATLDEQGIVRLSNSISSDGENTVATSKAVKSACDFAQKIVNERALLVHKHVWNDIENIPVSTTAVKGIVQLNSAINSTSESLAATSSAVKQAYDLANTAKTAAATAQTTANSKLSTANFAGNAVANGYQKFPNGLIIQWGSINANVDSAVVITFPIAFSSTCFHISGSGSANKISGGINQSAMSFGALTRTTATLYNDDSTEVVRWIAIGK